MYKLPKKLDDLLDIMSKCNMRYIVCCNNLIFGDIKVNALSNNMPLFQLKNLVNEYNIIGYEKIFDNIFLIGKYLDK